MLATVELYRLIRRVIAGDLGAGAVSRFGMCDAAEASVTAVSSMNGCFVGVEGS
jgi:hypothetical protein